MFYELEKTLIDIKQELSLYRDLFALSINSLTTQKQVSKFLGISQKTLYLYIKNGILIENEHYIKDKKIEFLPYKVIEFKQQNTSKKLVVKQVQNQIDPIAAKFLRSSNA